MLIDREMSKDRKFKYICRRFGVVIKIPTINYLFPHSKKSNLGGAESFEYAKKIIALFNIEHLWRRHFQFIFQG